MKEKIIELLSTDFELDAGLLAQKAELKSFPTWDSVGLLMLMVALNDAFGVNLDESDMALAKDVDSIESLVKQKIEA